jgi:hypothetical protein
MIYLHIQLYSQIPLDEHYDCLIKLEDTLDLLNREVIFTAVRRATLHLSQAVPIGQALSSKDSSGVGGDSVKSIYKMIENKANKTDLDRLNDTKSNKLDTTSALNGVEVINFIWLIFLDFT